MKNFRKFILTNKRSNLRLFVQSSIFAVLAAFILSLSVFSSPASAQRTALINASTVTGGATSREAVAATAEGFTVTVVTDAVWDAMTAAQFGAFDLLIIGDPTCSNSSANAAISNSATWAPVVMGTAGGRTQAGNRILIGTDPVFHFGQGGSALIPRGIRFAGAQTGRTGLYFTTSCTSSTFLPAILTTLDSLSTGTGTWTANNVPPCGGSVSLIASEPSFAGLTSANLQGWGCSVHTTYPTFKSDWNALAVATDTPTTPTCGVDPNTGMSRCGQAYILVAGSSIVVVSDSIALSPLTATNPVNTPHTVTATVRRSGSPLPNQVVTFTVTGANAGATGTCSPAGCITNASGLVTFTYTGTNVGNDTITGSFTDINGSLQSATAQKTWVAGTGTVCTPTTTVTEGDLFPGGLASFGVSSGPGSVTVDHVNAGTGLQSLTVVGTPVNAVVNIPAFTPGTTAPVVVTFTPIDPTQPVDFTLRAASTFHAIFIRAQCGIEPRSVGLKTLAEGLRERKR